LRRVLEQLNGDDLINARLACKTFRDHSKPSAVKHRDANLSTRALAEYAWDALPGYVLPRTHVLWKKWQGKLNLCSSFHRLKLH
jgi:hypothetical protein